ncbi:MAG: YqeG family HAD IIIA-type phosphatase [Breznakia sp.]
MIKKLQPKEYRKDFQHIDINHLKTKGIKLIICDLDNTLVAHDEPLPNEQVRLFIEKVKRSGLQICVISNNQKGRVKTFVKDLDIYAYAFAKKPLSWTYRKVKKDYALQGCEIAAVGDQILTDVWGGNRQGMYTILTHPLAQKDLKSTKVNRLIEQFLFKRLDAKGVLKKGVFDE